MKIIKYLVVAASLLLLLPNTAEAQKDKNGDKKETTKKEPKAAKEPKTASKEPKPEKGGGDKPKTEKTAKAGPKVVSNTGTDYTGLSREEKNTMTKCPMHGKKMSLSDNYRSNASDYHESEGYPFARQLNYRRACSHCTKAMIKEEKAAKKLKNKNAGEATFERCEIHNQTLYISDNYHAIDYERYPDENSPHAKQYKYKTHCAACTKAYDRANKSKEKDNKEKEKADK